MLARPVSRLTWGVSRLLAAPRFSRGSSEAQIRLSTSLKAHQVAPRFLSVCAGSNAVRRMTTIAQNTDGCVLGYFDTLELGPGAASLDASLVESLKKHLKATGAKGKQGESRLYVSPEGSPTRVALISLGVKPQDPLVLAERARHAVRWLIIASTLSYF